MDMQGSRLLPATQQQAWDALNDPAVLKACIAGCEKLDASGEHQYTAVLALKIGPVAARFNGKVQLSDVQPPQRYTLGFEGQGGPAGFGKGSAQVELAPAPGDAAAAGCELRYTVHAQVGGKIAQVGQRLIDGVARSMAEDFFSRFEAQLRQRHPPPEQADQAAEPTDAAGAATDKGALQAIPAWAWAALAALVLAGLISWMV